VACLIAAVASLMRGSRYVHELHGASEAPATAQHDAARPAATVAVSAIALAGAVTPPHGDRSRQPEPARALQ
jgi:hypothetical protein